MTVFFGGPAAYDALKSIGAFNSLRFWIYDSWALVGKKGSNEGTFGVMQ
jgi:hypothetical protein